MSSIYIPGNSTTINLVASHSSAFGSLLSKPHPPSPSPKEKERCSISLINYITTTSTSVLYPSLLKFPIAIRVSDKRGLCAVPLSRARRRMERLGEALPSQLQFFTYHSLCSLPCRYRLPIIHRLVSFCNDQVAA
jgi:hypothetical protein